jgi:hypothetical protein
MVSMLCRSDYGIITLFIRVNETVQLFSMKLKDYKRKHKRALTIDMSVEQRPALFISLMS